MSTNESGPFMWHLARPYLILLLATGLMQCGPSAWQGGVHAKFRFSQSHGLRVVDVPAEGPAAEAGLRRGDRIVKVDGEAVERMTLDQVVERLRGPVGSYVQLTVVRDGKQIPLHVERAPYNNDKSVF